MYITSRAGAPCAKTVSFARNLRITLPRPAESRNNFTSKVWLFEVGFWGERRTFAETLLRAQDTIQHNTSILVDALGFHVVFLFLSSGGLCLRLDCQATPKRIPEDSRSG